MPKVYITQQERDDAHAEEADNAVRLAVATRMMREGITQKLIAERIGLTAVTMSRRLAHPETFTIGELRRLRSALGLSDAETARCV